MTIEQILILVCLALFLLLLFSSILHFHLAKQVKEVRAELEGLYSIRKVEVQFNAKKLQLIFCVPYYKRNESKTDQANIILSHLTINNYGTPLFDKMPWRSHLRDHGIRNVRITEL